jgi:hypothetical protein
MTLSRTRTAWLALTPIAVALGIATVVAQNAVETDIPPDSPALIQGPYDISAGKLVQSPQGQTIGTVRELVSTYPSHGIPDYVLVATRTGTTAIPYGAMDHMLRDAHLVVDPAVLAAAPHVEEDQVHNLANTRWRQEADSYWQAYR